MLARKANHALNLIVSLKNMKENDFLCDFTIVVCDCSFLVHRAVLAACSGYFKAMFSSNMKEVREGLVDMKGLDAIAMKRCIEFMYSGEIVLTTCEVQDILQASSLLQLEDLIDRCLRFLESNLSIDNCLFTINMSRLYGRDDITQAAMEFTRVNFRSMTTTEMFPFVTDSDLTYYIRTSNCEYDTLWKAIAVWLRCNGNGSTQSFKQVVKLVNSEIFPFNFLFNTALDELVKENCNQGVELVLSNIFSNHPALEMNLNLENCFTLHHLNQSRKCQPEAKQAGNVIISFMAANLDKVVRREEFLRFEKGDVLKLFRVSQNRHHGCECVIWDAIRNWVGHTEGRKKDFSELFLGMNLDNIACYFIKHHLIGSELLLEAPVCKERILQSVKNRIQQTVHSNKRVVPCVATFDNETNIFRTLEVPCRHWSSPQNVPADDIRRVTSVGGKIFALGQRLLSLENDGSWKVAAMQQRQPCPWCQITSFQGALHVVEGRYMARYDIQRDEWSHDLPGCALVIGFFLASDDKSLYAMGGKNATKYEPSIKEWLPIAPMRIQRYDASAAVVNEVIFVMGGTLFGKVYKSVECYDPQSRCWTDIVNMQEPRSHFSACVFGNAIYAVGGSKRTDAGNNAADSVEVFDLKTRQWELVMKMNTTSGRVLSCFHELDITDIIARLEYSVSKTPHTTVRALHGCDDSDGKATKDYALH